MAVEALPLIVLAATVAPFDSGLPMVTKCDSQPGPESVDSLGRSCGGAAKTQIKQLEP